MAGLVAILLAAGSASRFGSDKLLHRLADGTPVAVAAAANLLAAGQRVLAVVRPAQTELAAALTQRGVQVHPCPQAERGMGASLACAIAASSDAAGWLVALGDMPYIQPASIEKVAAALANGATLAAPTLDGQRFGHPVGFSAAWRPALLQLDGDSGARTLIATRRNEMTLIPCTDPGITHDIDVPADLA